MHDTDPRNSELAQQLLADLEPARTTPEPARSWLSEWWKKIFGPKVPTDTAAKNIICSRLSVVGPVSYVDVISGPAGSRFTMMTGTKETRGSYTNVWCLANGEQEIMMVGPDGQIKARITMIYDGRITNVWPAQPDPEPGTEGL